MEKSLDGKRYHFQCKPLAIGGSTSQLYEVTHCASKLDNSQVPPGSMAIKLANIEAKKSNFELEQGILQALKNTGMVPKIHDWQLITPPYFLSMEYFANLQPLKPTLLEQEAIGWAIKYSELVRKLHGSGYANHDRKLGDIGLVDDGKGGKRLVVIDWGGVVNVTEQNIKFDIELIARFWYELMLSTPPPRSSPPQNHRLWPKLSFGVQQILLKGLQKKYAEIDEMLKDWQNVAELWEYNVKQLENSFKQKEQDDKPVEAFIHLDMIRLKEPDIWKEQYNQDAARLRTKFDKTSKLTNKIAQQIATPRLRYTEPTHAHLKGPLDELKNISSLQARRWNILVDLGHDIYSSSTKADETFRNNLLSNWIESLKQLEAQNWEEAIKKFWKALEDLPNLPLCGRSYIQQTKELVQQGEIGKAQAKIDELCTKTDKSITKQLLEKIFGNPSPCLAWSIEATLRKELDKSEIQLREAVDALTRQNFQLPQLDELVKNTELLEKLHQSFTDDKYKRLLDDSSIVWPENNYKKLTEALDKWQNNQVILTESNRLAELGKFDKAHKELKKVEQELFETRFASKEIEANDDITEQIIVKMIQSVQEQLNSLEKTRQIQQLIPKQRPSNLSEVIQQLKRLNELDKSPLDKHPFLKTQFANALKEIREAIKREEKNVMSPFYYQEVQQELIDNFSQGGNTYAPR